ncbi:hypothetical protein COOONC_00154 [Cooperia oncophora]
MFADDIKLYKPVGFPERFLSIQKAVQTVYEWSVTWGNLDFLVNNLDFGPHYLQIADKGEQRLFFLLKSLGSRDPLVLIRAYKMFVRHILEYGACGTMLFVAPKRFSFAATSTRGEIIKLHFSKARVSVGGHFFTQRARSVYAKISKRLPHLLATSPSDEKFPHYLKDIS